ncbi:MFS transporter [Acanthopleuribacter pedis]|uniref:MFS transporter n=1 Tax=Acanthopleuribacter pedis TaxID=442870 RepID=A0A8J7QQM3_9BACT|nr:MFS transporter [Acanthopleuribacter pedis]MBO1323060.1 MFS transporter [Acanthopleuribacter pedis]
MRNTAPTAQPADKLGNISFIAFTLTQYLGAFNDNVFKQMMLFMALSISADDKQGVVMVIFSVPFLLFSGMAGLVSERFSKTTVMRASKVGEWVIMGLGALGFYLQSWELLLFTLFLMGTQSTFFGPAKYGAIPEIVQTSLLVKANGIVQMTTFLAIILGMAFAGILTDSLKGQLWWAGVICMGISILGILTVYQIKPRQANRPDIPFGINPFGNMGRSLKKIWHDKPLLDTVIAASFFWFSGGIVTQAINNYGTRLLGLDERSTSFLLAALSAGIMLGCLLCSLIEKKLGSKRTIILGGVCVAVGEGLLYFTSMPMGMIYTSLLLAGIGSGLYYVPMAAYMQAKPPLGEKGEILGAINFCNYIGIVGSGLVWTALTKLDIPANWSLVGLALSLVVLIVVMLPQLGHLDESLDHET